MQVQMVNRKAMDKYQTLHNALETVRLALEESAKLHKKIGEPEGDPAWRVPDADDVIAAYERARDQLTALHTATVKWEKELVSKGWRV